MHVTIATIKSVKQFDNSFVLMHSLCGMLYLMRFVHPPLLPLSERGLNPISTPQHAILSLNTPGCFPWCLTPFLSLDTVIG